jgi:hypothetical protein
VAAGHPPVPRARRRPRRGIFALVTSDLWRLSDALGVARLAALTVGSVTAVVLTIVVGARLLERAPAGSPVRAQVVLFNVVTVATVVIGVVALYLALFVLTLLGVLLLVPGSLLASALGHAVGIGDQLELAWLASVGGHGGRRPRRRPRDGRSRAGRRVHVRAGRGAVSPLTSGGGPAQPLPRSAPRLKGCRGRDGARGHRGGARRKPELGEDVFDVGGDRAL